MTRKLLEGVRVLDLTNVLSGPFATLHLALLGAEVVKIENPAGGDLARKLGNVPKLSHELMGTSFLAQNAGKKSVTLNLKSEKGREVFRKLAERADVLVENFRPGVMERLGLSYETLAARNPRLVYCAISGFGQTGPDAQRPAYDQIIQGLSGTMAVTRRREAESAPVRLPRLRHRRRAERRLRRHGRPLPPGADGRGTDDRHRPPRLDHAAPGLGGGQSSHRGGASGPPGKRQLHGGAFRHLCDGGTGYVNIAANKQEQWESVADVLGVPELKSDPRFAERDTRKKNRKLLTPLLEERLKTRTTAEWVEALNDHDVPSGAILSLHEALKQPQVAHRRTLRSVPVPGIGDLPLFSLTALFEKTPGGIDAPPPRLSEHTEEILTGAGYSKNEIAEMRRRGIV